MVVDGFRSFHVLVTTLSLATMNVTCGYFHWKNNENNTSRSELANCLVAHLY